MPTGHITAVRSAQRKAKSVGVQVPRVLELDGAHWIAAKHDILAPRGAGLDITIGVRLKSQGSGWSHNWRADYGRSRQLRIRAMHALACVDLETVLRHLSGPPNAIRFVRLAPRALDDDNLRTAFKPIRDQVCAWLAGNNSADARANDGMRSGYAFDYGQQQQKLYGVRIEIRRET